MIHISAKEFAIIKSLFYPILLVSIVLLSFIGTCAKEETSSTSAPCDKWDSAYDFKDKGMAFYNQGVHDSAVIYLKQALDCGTPIPDLELERQLGMAYTKLEKFDSAAVVFERIVQQVPNNTDALFNLAHTYGELEEFVPSRNIYFKILEQDSLDVGVLNNIGWTYEQTKDYDIGLQYYQKALDIQPDYYLALSNMSEIYLAKGQTRLAIQSLQRFIALNPDAPDVFEDLGDAYLEKEEFAIAILAYQKAKAKQDSTKVWRTLLKLGDVYHEKKRYNTAIDYYQQAATIKKNLMLSDKKERHKEDMAIILQHIGNAYYEQEDLKQAVELYKKGLEMNPKNEVLHNNLGWTFLRLHELEQAEDYLSKTWELSTFKSAYASMNLGHVALFRHDNTMALQWYKKSLPLWEAPQEFSSKMIKLFDQLQMKEKGISKTQYLDMLDSLKAM